MARILIYALNYAPEPFGVGRYTGEIGAFLAKDQHEVRVVTAVPHYPAWEVSDGYKAWRFHRETRAGASVVRCPIFLKRPMRGVWRLLAPLSFAFASLPALLWDIIRYRPDVMFCVEPSLFNAPAALALSKLFGIKTILHVQDLEVEAAFAVGHLKGGLTLRMMLWLEGVLMRRFDQVITISERMADKIKRKGVAPSRLALIRNWVNLEAIRPLSAPNSYRAEYGWPDDLVVGLYAGSVGAKQALEVALDAAAQLGARDNFMLVIAGEGPAKRDLMACYGHLPNVRFIPAQPEDRLCELLNLADIHILPQSRGVADLVLPSKLGGMLASGRPVLATADQGTELFQVLDGVGILVPAGDSAAMARELAAFIDRGARRGSERAELSVSLAQMFSRAVCLPAIEDNVLNLVS